MKEGWQHYWIRDDGKGRNGGAGWLTSVLRIWNASYGGSAVKCVKIGGWVMCRMLMESVDRCSRHSTTEQTTHVCRFPCVCILPFVSHSCEYGIGHLVDVFLKPPSHHIYTSLHLCLWTPPSPIFLLMPPSELDLSVEWSLGGPLKSYCGLLIFRDSPVAS